MHSSKIRPTLLPERGRRETATIPPTANPIPNAGERAGKKQLSMQSDIQITNRNDTCFVDIEGVIGVPEEWQFDQPSSRVATYEKFRDSLDRLREIDAPEIVVNIRSTGGDVNDALLIYEALSSLDGHIVTRCYGYTASAATVIAQAASEGCREISAHALYLIHNSICTAEGNILHFGDPEKGSGPRTSELALHEGQQFAAPTRTLPREDPSIGETTPSANQRAYAEDAKQLIR